MQASDLPSELLRLSREFPPVQYRYCYMGTNQYTELCSKVDLHNYIWDGNSFSADLGGIKVTVFPVRDFGPILSEKDWGYVGPLVSDEQSTIFKEKVRQRLAAKGIEWDGRW